MEYFGMLTFHCTLPPGKPKNLFRIGSSILKFKNMACNKIVFDQSFTHLFYTSTTSLDLL